MLKIKMYSIYDKKSRRFDTPFFANDDVNAIRHFTMLVNDKKSMLSEFKDDFQVHSLLQFDIITGEIKTFNKEIIVEGNQIIGKEVDKS